MTYTAFLIKYAEIGIKGKNRYMFEDALVRQIERSAEFRNEKVALLEARRHYCWYLKGVKYANYYKDQINHMETLEDLYRVTAGIKRDLSD